MNARVRGDFQEGINWYLALSLLAILFLGVVIGGFLFGDTRPRVFRPVVPCAESCWASKEILAVMASVGIQKFPSLVSVLPLVVYETDKTLVIQHPVPRAPLHYVLIPKKDIRSVEDVAIDDQAYIMDALAVVRYLAKIQHLARYQIVTNSPGYQKVSYLHFHLLSEGSVIKP